MSGWVTVCAATEIEREDVVRFDHAGRTYAVYRAADESVWCTDGLCSHEAVHLSDGLVDAFEIECPKHASIFDIRTGEVMTPPACENLRTHPARIEGGQVQIEID